MLLRPNKLMMYQEAELTLKDRERNARNVRETTGFESLRDSSYHEASSVTKLTSFWSIGLNLNVSGNGTLA